MPSDNAPSNMPPIVTYRSVHALVEHYQALNLKLTQKRIEADDFIPALVNCSEQWLGLYQQSPESISSLYFLPLGLRFTETRYLKTCILILNLVETLSIPTSLASCLLTAAGLKDIAVFKALNKPSADLSALINKKKFAAKLYQSAAHSAKISRSLLKPTAKAYMSIVPELVFNQYEYLDGSGPNQLHLPKFDEHNFNPIQLFSLCCHLVNLPALYPKLNNWTLQLKFLVRHQFNKIDSGLLTRLYQQFSGLPAGSSVLYQKMPALLLLKNKQSERAIILQNSQACLCGLNEIAPTETDPKITLTASLYETALNELMNEQAWNTRAINLPGFNLKISPQLRLLYRQFTRHPDPIDLLTRTLKSKPDSGSVLSERFQQSLAQDLIEYANQLGQTQANISSPIRSINQAVMYLGSDALEHWLIHQAIKAPLYQLNHASSAALRQYLFLAQTIAADLSRLHKNIHPELSKMLISCLFYPYFFHPNLTTRLIKPEKVSTQLNQIFRFNKNQTELIVKLAKNAGLAQTLIEVLQESSVLEPQSVKHPELTSCLKLAILSVGLIYHSPKVDKMNQLAQADNQVYDEVKQSLSSLNMDWSTYYQLLNNNLEKHHYFCPFNRVNRL